ncbi:MAG: glycoside hydrolase family 31 protein [Eubacteriales bacterium]|jgi:alpha-glucosidase|nr:glycoside hydrolase family 31 protein [Eubacteriales bacterium]
MIDVTYLKNSICRIRMHNPRSRESLMTRYNILRTEFPPEDIEPFCQTDGQTLTLSGEGYTLYIALDCGAEGGGFDISLTLAEGERLFGLGDESRTCVMKRGRIAQIKQENVRSYGPVPYVMSSRGWGLLVNCTYAHTFDLGKSEADKLRIYSQNGALDFFVFLGGDMREALRLYTDVSGRPVMLPREGYGLTFVMNEDASARTLLDDALRFRERGIPCDILGLEPSWMSKHYDDTTGKKWNKERFYLPSWQPENYYGGWSFIYNLNKMGYMLSLWLCISHDLFWKEEREAGDSDIQTDGTEDWFEHLKKFVDNGARAFKLDGSSQVIPFPDRIWAGRYTDDEIRNIYPLVYAKQMKEGFQAHTGERAMINTCGTYAGTQKYAATWAGDTGCTPAVLISLMNFAMCGHSNTSFDMTAENKASIHFGFLAPWTQHQGWDNWLYPWYMDEDTEETYRYYARLRSSLFPYIYSYAHTAHESGLPILRPLSLTYLENDRYDEVFNEYMLGDSLLVSVFDNHIILPEEDDWYDYFTGERHAGGSAFDYIPPKNRGGALFVRAGSIIVTQDRAHSLRDYRPESLWIHVYPGRDADFTLYEDDGRTYAYEQGEVARTKISLRGGKLTVGRREGSYEGMGDATAFKIVLHAGGDSRRYVVSAKEHAAGEVTIELKR